MKNINFRLLILIISGLLLLACVVIHVFNLNFDRKTVTAKILSNSERNQLNKTMKTDDYVPVMVMNEQTINKKVVKEIESTNHTLRPSVSPQQNLALRIRSNEREEISKVDAVSVPNIFARYELPISDYIVFMRARGSRIIVYDTIKNVSICEVSPLNKITEYRSIDGFSRNSRRLTDDYPAHDLLYQVEKQYGFGSYEILLILPNDFSRHFESNIANILKTKGVSQNETSTVYLSYSGSNKMIIVNVEKVISTHGIISIKKAFKL